LTKQDKSDNLIITDKANNYLKDTLNININQNKKWSTFQENSKIRNFIIHNSGNIIKDYEKSIGQQPDYKMFVANKNITVTDTGSLFINSSERIRQILVLEIEFINEVYSEVIKKLKEETK